MASHIVAPSILAADFANLERDVKMVNDSAAQIFHIDVMDGVFVPNISFGMPVIKAIKKHAAKPLDVHLMIVDPDRYITTFKECGADILTVHYEACNHLHRTLGAIREAGMQSGVALNPHTPVEVLSDVLGQIDMVCLMSVNPGFGGQSFIEGTYDKVRRLVKMREAAGVKFEIEIDGGVNGGNARKLVDAGASILVAGSYVFKSATPKETIFALVNV